MMRYGLILNLPLLLFPGLLAAWSAPVAGADPPAFADVCFDDFNDAKPWPSQEEVKTMLGRVDGGRYDLSTSSKDHWSGSRPATRISGTFRLNMPWKTDHALRISVVDTEHFRIHLWRGREGVTVRYYREPFKCWIAYTTRRSSGKPSPEDFIHVGSSGGRYRHDLSGTIELRYQDGKLVVSRGDLVLIVAPMAGIPQEVYLEGSAKIRGIAMIPSGPAPLPEPAEYPVVLETDRPADLSWNTRLPEGVRFEKQADGSVVLSADDNTERGEASFRLGDDGLFEITLLVDDAEVGSGIYLGNAEGNHIGRLTFIRVQNTDKMAFTYTPTWTNETEKSYDANKPIPFTGRRRWIRLVYGAGVMQHWTSFDGKHWCWPVDSTHNGGGRCTQIGLFCIDKKPRRSIRLRSVRIRRLDRIESLVPAELRRRTKIALLNGDDAEWERRVTESRPADVPADEWRRACIFEFLQNSKNADLAQRLLKELLDYSIEQYNIEQADSIDPLVLLQEAWLMRRTEEWAVGWPMGEQFERLGRRLAVAGHPAPYSAIQAVRFRDPAFSHSIRDEWPGRLLHHELMILASAGDWEGLADLCRRVRFWGRPLRIERAEPAWGKDVEYVLRWAEQLLVRQNVAGYRPPENVYSLPPYHPLVERTSKEGFNVMAEFHAALQAEAYREACLIISNTADPHVMGLLPDAQDPRLSVSPLVALALAMQRTPALNQAMREHFGPLARLRVQQAINEADAAAVEAVTLQFFGTEAAAEAHAWLGDRALSSGAFSEAAGHYRHALDYAPTEDRQGLLARLRLAGAMVGRNTGQPADGTVEIGDNRLTAAEFERLVEQLRQSRHGPLAATEGTTDADDLPLPGPPDSGGYEWRKWTDFDGSRIRRPGGIPEDGPDWAARQIAMVVNGDGTVVQHPYQLSLLESENGNRRWSFPPNSRSDESRWFRMLMRPVVAPDRIFLRAIIEERPELFCIDRNNGELVFRSSLTGYAASNPILVGRDVLVLTAHALTGDQISLSMTRFDGTSGRQIERTPLAEFRDVWDGRLNCRVTLADDALVATVGGCVLCCDLMGRPRWLRRQVSVPPPAQSYDKAALWLDQRHGPPLLVDGRVYATQPGTWDVECLDLATGRLHWRRPIISLEGLAGRFGRRLIVETTDGLLALDADSGKRLWYHPTSKRLEGLCLGRPGGIVFARQTEMENPSDDRHRTMLVWVDPDSGTSTGEVMLGSEPQKYPRLGPIVAHDSRLWVFAAPNNSTAQREILELVEKPGP